MIFGLVGQSLKHSFSLDFFTQKFENERIPAVYQNFELQTIDEIKDVFNISSLKGLNVTIPYKQVVVPYLDDLTEEAQVVGAVNTILFDQGRMIGANTDVFGFREMIKPFLLNTHERALVLGNGGASKAVSYVLKSIGLDVHTVARNPKDGEFEWREMNDMMVKHCGIIVNTTPVGMWPDVNACIELPFDALTGGHLVVDLIYNPEQTEFLKRSSEQGAVVLNGRTMLYQQAEKSWELWKSTI